MDKTVDSKVPESARALPSDVDVLVTGLGPVGATLAVLLGRQGVRTLVIDKATDIFMAPRAIALDNEALRILQLAGLEDFAFDKCVIPYVSMRSPQLGEFARFITQKNVDGHPELVTFFQPDLEHALRAKLADYASVQVQLGVELKDFRDQADGVVAQLLVAGDTSPRQVRTCYLVGADGASSTVRRIVGMGYAGKSFIEDWLVIDARNVPNPIDHVEFNCDWRRPYPHMVASGGRQRWEFMLHAGESGQEMLSQEHIRKLLLPWDKNATAQIERKAVYRFHSRAVDAFSKGRVFLVGDAAHITPPFAGQGLVSGLRDVANLGWKLAWVVQERAPAKILRTYDQERRPHAKAMIKLALFIGKMVMPRNAIAAFVVHGVMRTARLFPPLRRYMDRLGFKPKNIFKHGLFIGKGRSLAGLVRGGLFPQGNIRSASGQVMRSDDVLGDTLALVGFGVDPRPLIRDAQYEQFTAAAGRVLPINAQGVKAANAWEDIDGTFAVATNTRGWVALVRPDKTVLHDGPVAQCDQILREALAQLKCPTNSESRQPA
jgi:3-(3-hydroxy-phenyl)propionate hydroxylase